MQMLGNFGAFDRSKAEGATEAVNLLFMALAFNAFFGVTRLIDTVVAGENPPPDKLRGIRSKKAGLYVLLTIVAQIIHSGGGPQWWQPLEGAWSLLSTGFVLTAIVFFVAGFVPARVREATTPENWRTTRDLSLVSNWFLCAGVVLLFLSVFVFALLPLRQDSVRFLLFSSTLEIAAGLGCIVTFFGLKKLKNWARIVAMILAAITAPFSWYVLWVLGFTDARRAFKRKLAAHGG